MKNDLIKRLEGHIETLRGVASSVYSDDIQEAVVALEQTQESYDANEIKWMNIASGQLKRIEQLEAELKNWLEFRKLVLESVGESKS